MARTFPFPDSLPDWKRLNILLANSGVQKWNPPLYDILDKIINTNFQSQGVLAQRIGEGGSIFVNEALTGDGTEDNPLSVLYDGTSIDVNGSNQLRVISSSDLQFTVDTFGYTHSNIINADKVEIVAAPSSSQIVVPLWCWVRANWSLANAYTTTRACGVRYSRDVGGGGGYGQNDILSFLNLIPGGTAVNRWMVAAAQDQQFDFDVPAASKGSPVGKSLVFASVNTNANGNAANSITGVIAWATMDQP